MFCVDLGFCRLFKGESRCSSVSLTLLRHCPSSLVGTSHRTPSLADSASAAGLVGLAAPRSFRRITVNNLRLKITIGRCRNPHVEPPPWHVARQNAGARSNTSLLHCSRATSSGDPTPSTGSPATSQFRLSLGSTPLSRDCGAGFFVFQTGSRRSLRNHEPASSHYFVVFSPKSHIVCFDKPHAHRVPFVTASGCCRSWEVDTECVVNGYVALKTWLATNRLNSPHCIVEIALVSFRMLRMQPLGYRKVGRNESRR